jgi:hypothetical protein
MLQRETLRLLGPVPDSVRRYRRALDRELAKLNPKKCLTREKLIKQASRSDVICIGDYHTDPQASRSALRILRDLLEICPKDVNQWSLGVEMISSDHQEALDAYAASKISTSRFLDQIGYQENWGFPWSLYEPLLEFAKAEGIRLLALNRPVKLFPVRPKSSHSISRLELQELHARDEWAAGLIVDRFKERPRSTLAILQNKIAVLYGEAHLAQRHLPDSIRTLARPLSLTPKVYTIHQNHDPTYWRLQAQSWPDLPAAIQMTQQSACIFSGTPWGRKQSLLDFLSYDPPEESALPESPSLSESQWLDRLGSTLNLIGPHFEVPQSALDQLRASLTLKTAVSADFINSRDLINRTSTKVRSFARTLVAHNQRFYLPEVQVVFISSPSPNRIHEMAARVLFHHLQLKNCNEMIPSFWHWVLEQSAGYALSLLLNPKRKCDLPQDHQKRIRALRKNPKLALFPQELDARSLALRLWLTQKPSERKRALRHVPQDLNRTTRSQLFQFFLTARYLGQLTGRALSLHHSLTHAGRHTSLGELFHGRNLGGDTWTELHSKTQHSLSPLSKESAI